MSSIDWKAMLCSMNKQFVITQKIFQKSEKILFKKKKKTGAE